MVHMPGRWVHLFTGGLPEVSHTRHFAQPDPQGSPYPAPPLVPVHAWEPVAAQMQPISLHATSLFVKEEQVTMCGPGMGLQEKSSSPSNFATQSQLDTSSQQPGLGMVVQETVFVPPPDGALQVPEFGCTAPQDAAFAFATSTRRRAKLKKSAMPELFLPPFWFAMSITLYSDCAKRL
jgi:hypothetical protein